MIIDIISPHWKYETNDKKSFLSEICNLNWDKNLI